MSGTARDIKRRLKSIHATQQMTKAMKTVAVAKYNKTLSVIRDYDAYAAQCRHLREVLGDTAQPQRPEKAQRAVCYVVVSGNRGLCGMYNIELMRFLQQTIDAESRPVRLVLCGRYAQENIKTVTGAAVLRSFELEDIPDFESAREICEYVSALYDRGEVEEVSFLCQLFKNVLVQTPGTVRLFPPQRSAEKESATREYIFEPDREALQSELLRLCDTASVYRTLLDCALGVHSATLSAMRTASENSGEMYDTLSQKLNRLRQAAATTEVIELAGGAAAAEEQERGSL